MLPMDSCIFHNVSKFGWNKPPISCKHKNIVNRIVFCVVILFSTLPFSVVIVRMMSCMHCILPYTSAPNLIENDPGAKTVSSRIINSGHVGLQVW